MEFEQFSKLPLCKVRFLTLASAKPKLGVFVPDGSRRLVMAFTKAEPDSEEFYQLCATLPAKHLLGNLRTFFEYGLSILLVPILSRSVLNRGEQYQQVTALSGLKLLFDSDEWRTFYHKFNIRVRVYGDPMRLAQSHCAQALDWIYQTIEVTSNNKGHTLFFAIGESPRIGEDIGRAAIDYYKQYDRYPTLDEQIVDYYGELLPPADFFIMSSKMSGLGALPRFLINSDTAVYFLPAPDAINLNSTTYRLILFDLLYKRPYVEESDDLNETERKCLRQYYDQYIHHVIGTGRLVSGKWVPQC